MNEYIDEQIDCARASLEDAKSRDDKISVAYYEGQINAFELVRGTSK